MYLKENPKAGDMTQKVFAIKKRDYELNSKEQWEAHKKRTGGVFYTRFPPEPNGHLHWGHAKAICFNFDLAGKTILRYDDTNPASEAKEYADSIKEVFFSLTHKSLDWLGFKPCKITHTSDYFQQLYDFAVQLIKQGDAYVDHQTPDEIKESRQNKIPSEWRKKRTVEENLREFEKMRDGLYGEGEATLRVIGDFNDPCPQMWDFIAYRINFTPHPSTGSKWCIYPSYDFSHCIVDSLEDIDASCCSLEFEIRRKTYYWLLNKLNLYKPHVYEFSRMNLKSTCLSKRVLREMVNQKIVDGWNDPRMPTLKASERRGVPPEVGVSRNENIHEPSELYYYALQHLNETSPRGFAVINPLKIKITNFNEGNTQTSVSAYTFPALLEKSPKHSLELSDVVYIDRSDFKVKANKKFFGLTLNKTVRLKYGYNIKCTKVIYEGDEKEENVKELECEIDFENKEKIKKGFLGFVAAPVPKYPGIVITRYEELFAVDAPSRDKWKSELTPNSRTEVKSAYVDSFVRKLCEKYETTAWLVSDINELRIDFPNKLKIFKDILE